jgi:hypothetical protein
VRLLAESARLPVNLYKMAGTLALGIVSIVEQWAFAAVA